MTNRTEQAAQYCADLTNAENTCAQWSAEDFTIEHTPASQRAFRREVEAKDAMIREVLEEATELLSITAHPTQVKRLNAIIAKLRTNLLPDPQPTLLREVKS